MKFIELAGEAANGVQLDELHISYAVANMKFIELDA